MKKILRIQLLLLAFVCATTAYAQVVQTFGDKYYYDWFQIGANDEIIYEHDSENAWVTTVDAGEWDIVDNEGVQIIDGGFYFGGPNGKIWGTVTSPDFDSNAPMTLVLDLTQSQHGANKSDFTITFHQTYKDDEGQPQEHTITVHFDFKNSNPPYTVTGGSLNITITANNHIVIEIPLPEDYASGGHTAISIGAHGGMTIGASSSSDKIELYSEELVLRDDWDNTERLTRNAGKKLKKVTIVRSYDKGWYTLSLPFDLTMKQFQRRYMVSFDKDLADTYTWEEETCAEIWHYDSFDERSEIMHFRKHDDADFVLKAGVPYLIYVPADISSTLYDFTRTSEEVVNSDEYTSGEEIMVFTNIELQNPASSVSTVTKGNASFASNLGKTDIADVIEDNYVYYLHTDSEGENPQLFKPQSGSTIIKGFRSYFYSPIDSPSRSLFFNDDEVTAIDKVDVQSEQKMPVFNLQGLHMNNDLNGLPRGIYIMNGKKYVVK